MFILKKLSLGLAIIALLTGSGCLKSSSAPQEPTNSNSSSANQVESSDSKTLATTNFKIYYDEKHNFSIGYPSTLLEKETTSCAIPTTNGKNITDNSAVSFEHTFPFEWQDDKGDTHQNMTDLAVKLCVVEGNYKELADYYHDIETSITINSEAAKKIEMGAEGTGADMYYIPLKENTTLVIGYYYVTPFAQPKLTEEKEYIPKQRQEELVEQMLRTLKIN